jgi:gamma-glutamyl hercynylcysteine S-oxide hydrolase
VCRHLAYLGPPVALHDPLFDAPHALVHQSRCPRHQTSGTTNPDGWGVGWYGDGGGAPERHRTVTPIWDDHAFAASAREVRSGAFLAAARLASPGATVDVAGNAPFLGDGWLFSLNGIVYGFADGVGERLRSAASARRRAAIVSDADTEVLFALVLDRLDAGEPADDALAHVVREVLALTTGRLNLLLTDGHQLAGTRVGNSLFARDGVVVSEPLDDAPGWTEVPDESVLRLTPAGLEVQAL